MEIPRELLTNGSNPKCLSRFREIRNSTAPKRECKTDQQNCFNNHNTKLYVRRGFALHAMIVRVRIAGTVKPEKREQEVGRPPDEEHQHEPVAKLEHVIHEVPVLGCIGDDPH